MFKVNVMIRPLNGHQIIDKRGKNTTIFAIKAVQKAPLRLLFLVKKQRFPSLFFFDRHLLLRVWLLATEYC